MVPGDLPSQLAILPNGPDLYPKLPNFDNPTVCRRTLIEGFEEHLNRAFRQQGSGSSAAELQL